MTQEEEIEYRHLLFRASNQLLPDEEPTLAERANHETTVSMDTLSCDLSGYQLSREARDYSGLSS